MKRYLAFAVVSALFLLVVPFCFGDQTLFVSQIDFKTGTSIKVVNMERSATGQANHVKMTFTSANGDPVNISSSNASCSNNVCEFDMLTTPVFSVIDISLNSSTAQIISLKTYSARDIAVLVYNDGATVPDIIAPMVPPAALSSEFGVLNIAGAEINFYNPSDQDVIMDVSDGTQQDGKLVVLQNPVTVKAGQIFSSSLSALLPDGEKCWAFRSRAGLLIGSMKLNDRIVPLLPGPSVK
jgi:hypothetical protein